MSDSSIKLPHITEVAITKAKELLAFSTLPYYQVGGNLTEAEDAVVIGDVVAWDATAKKWINYLFGGSGDEILAIGFVRIPGDPTDGDVAIEVVVGGAVKYSVVSVASNWNAAVITDLKARYIEAADALIF